MFCLGCHVLGPFARVESPAPAVSQAQAAWQEGQEAMRRGEPQAAVAHYRRSLEAGPELPQTYLSLAAAHLEAGDDGAAAEALARFSAAHPEQLGVRSYLAELLLRLKRPDDARLEFERYAADAQESREADAASLIHCQRRLMEIAEAREDDYGEHLHRGIGLYLLARQRAELPHPEEDLPVEGLLCKAAAELAQARREQPDRARPSWYLYVVWSRLGQRQAALRSLHEAQAAEPSFDLTPAEQRNLEQTWQQHRAESRK
jgi:tetratricopeptide (TPR) repeat protein